MPSNKIERRPVRGFPSNPLEWFRVRVLALALAPASPFTALRDRWPLLLLQLGGMLNHRLFVRLADATCIALSTAGAGSISTSHHRLTYVFTIGKEHAAG